MIGNFKSKGQTIIVCGMILLAIISLAFFVILNLSWVFIIPTKNTIMGVTVKQVEIDYHQLLSYLQNPMSTNINFKYIPMSGSGRHHFGDVKKLFLLNNLIGLLSTPGAVWLYIKQKKNQQLWKLLIPFQSALVFFPILCATLGMNFESLFIKFHQVVFNNDDWQFDPNADPIINVLTEPVFLEMALSACLIIEMGMLLVYITSRKQITQI